MTSPLLLPSLLLITLSFFLFQEIHLLENIYPQGSIHILDIGEGDSSLIITPNKQKILIDGGLQTHVLEKLDKHLSYFDKSIDIVIATHPHADHIMGLIEILKRFQVKQLFWTGMNYHSAIYKELINIAQKHNIPLQIIDGKSDFDLGNDTQIDIISPNHSYLGQEEKNINNSSIVFRLLWKNQALALFTGDAEKEQETEIYAEGLDIQSKLLKIGHHGSKTSTNSFFLNKIKPEIAVISVNEENRFNHPNEETLEKLGDVDVRMTRDVGTVSFWWKDLIDNKDIEDY